MKHRALDLKQMGRNITELRRRRGLTQAALACKPSDILDGAE